MHCINLRRLGALLMLLLPTLCHSQDPFHSVPMTAKNLKGAGLYEDNQGYSILLQHFVGFGHIHLLKNGKGKIGTNVITAAYTFQGLTSNEKSLTVYVKVRSKLRAIIFDKQSGSAAVHSDVDVAKFRPNERFYCGFTYADKFYALNLNKKMDRMSMYEFNETSAKHMVTLPVTPALMKQGTEEVAFISQDGRFDLKELEKKHHLYRQGDSLIFAHNGDDKTVFTSVNLVSKAIFTRTIERPKSDFSSNFLLGDKIFITFNSPLKRVAGDWRDSIFFQVLDLRTGSLLKQLNSSTDSGINWKLNPFLSAEGDSVESSWKPAQKNKLLVNKLETCDIHVTPGRHGNYVVTIGERTEISTYVATGMSGGTTVSTPGPDHFFRTCLSPTFEPILCDDIPGGIERAAMRAYTLRKGEGNKTGLLGRERYHGFKIQPMPNGTYLMYVDREKDLFIIERFPESWN